MTTRLVSLVAVALAACAAPPPPTPDASPDAAAEAAADAQSAPDAEPSMDARADVDAAALPDVASSPDVAPDAAPGTPALDTVFQEQTYWVLFESYPGDGMGTPAVRSSAIMPAWSRVAMPPAGGDATVLTLRQCATISPNGCEEILLRAKPLDISGIPTGRSGVCARLEPMGMTIIDNCSSDAAIEYRESARYADRLGQRRYNACWSAALGFDPMRPALWAIRGVPGRTRHPMRGDFCVFGIRDGS